MLETYRVVFREPGTRAFCAAAFVMRMPIAMYPIGLVLIVSARTHHYGFAGLLSACYVVGGVPGNPLTARWCDRYGQRRVVLPAITVHVAAAATLVALLETDAPRLALVAPALVLGFAYPSVVSLVRARWTTVLAGRPELTTAFSVESVLDEIVFIVGPLLATLLATQTDPVLVLVIGGALVTIGGLWLCAQTATEPTLHPRGADGHPAALRCPGMPLLVLGTTAMGGIFAGSEVSIVAFAGQHSARGASGVLLACFAFGSGTAGFVYGARHSPRGVVQRYLRQSLIFAPLPLVFFAGWSVPVVGVCAFVVGLGIAPSVITAFGLAERLVPAASLNEGMAWVTTGMNLGYGIASASVGRLADAWGARPSFVVAAAAGLAMGACALALTRQLRHASHPVVVAA